MSQRSVHAAVPSQSARVGLTRALSLPQTYEKIYLNQYCTKFCLVSKVP